MVCKVFIFLLILVGLGLRIEGYAQKADIVKAKVISERIDSSFEDKDFVNQSMEVRILEGINIGQVVTVNSSVNRSKAIDLYEKGDNIYLIKGMEGEYFFADRDRLPQIGIIFGIFFIIVVALAGKRGFGSIVGLASSVLIIAFYIIPQIVNGQDPFIVSLQGIFVAALVSFYFAHGFNRRTTIALVGTIITLVLAGVIAWYFTRLLSLTGSYSEDTAYLQRGVLENLDLRGLFLGGVMLGTLGVLDDITTAQVAAVEQLKKANFELDMRQLFVRSYEIGEGTYCWTCEYACFCIYWIIFCFFTFIYCKQYESLVVYSQF
ncbi:MAG: YibE/F family protein [Thermales bacterium]|nr:YibE/F family protein [Thermales bacterium]